MANILSMGRGKSANNAPPAGTSGSGGGVGVGGGKGGGKGGNRAGRSNEAPTGVVFRKTAESLSGLVFGMKWRAVLEHQQRKFVIREASNNKATHFNHLGHDFGYCRLSRGSTKNLTALYSAARVIYGQLGQNIVVALTIDRAKGEFWLCHFGAGPQPIEDELILTEALFRSRVDQLLQRASNSTLVTDLTGFQTGTDHTTRAFSYAELYDIKVKDTDLVSEVQQRSRLPAPLVWGGAFVVALMGANVAWDYYKAEKAKASALAKRFEKTDPVVHWRKAYVAWLPTQIVVEGSEIMPVVQSLTTIPAEWNLWRIDRTSCVIQPSTIVPIAVAGAASAPAVPAATAGADGGSMDVTWACTAGYTRTKAGAINTTMKPAIPPSYSVAFLPLDVMQISWSVHTRARRLTQQEVDSKMLPIADHFVKTSASLQQVSLALAGTPVYKFAPVKVPVGPTPEGEIVNPPSDFRMTVAPLEVSGPLRTIVKVANTNMPVSWTSVGMNISFSDTAPSVNTSNLNANLAGVIYANK